MGDSTNPDTYAQAFNILDNLVGPNLAHPTHPQGARFLGWWSEETGGERVLSGDEVTTEENRTLYARWGSIQVVTFDPNEGAFAEGTDLPVTRAVRNDLTIDSYAQAFNAADNLVNGNLLRPTREGHTFLGWYTTTDDEGVRVLSTNMVTSDSERILFARWELDLQFYLVFRFDGHNTNPSDEEPVRIPVTLGEEVEIPAELVGGVPPTDGILALGDVAPGHGFWGWFDDQMLDYGAENRPHDDYRRPMLNAEGWDVESLTLHAECFERHSNGNGNGYGRIFGRSYGNGDGVYEIHLTAIWFLWGDTNDDDTVGADDARRISQFLYNQLLISLGLPPVFDEPMNELAAKVTAGTTITGGDIVRLEQWLIDRERVQEGLEPIWNVTLGRP
jgi:uncharacterized repeat protein (TIGR02543 family)